MNFREIEDNDIEKAKELWNEVIRDGVAFPQENELSINEAKEFFKSQTSTVVAEDNNEIIGLYILHPNNVGRCSHIGNLSYIIDKSKRGNHLGEQLVKNSLLKAKEKGFKIIQFNAVVKDNISAIKIYEKLGFQKLGMIPNGFRKDSGYEDIVLYYFNLDKIEELT